MCSLTFLPQRKRTRDKNSGVFGHVYVVGRFVSLIEGALTQRILAQLQKQELISYNDVGQALSQEHTGFGVWMGTPFHATERTHFVTRPSERSALSLEKLSIRDDIATYTTKDTAGHEFDALEFFAQLSML